MKKKSILVLLSVVVVVNAFFALAWGQEMVANHSNSNAVVVGYTPEEGFRLGSADGNYRLRFQLRTGIKKDLTWTDESWEPSGMFSYLRPIIRGNLYKEWIRFFVAMELSGANPYLLDGFADIQPWDKFGFIFGQQGTPVSRHNSFGPQQIFFPDYAGVASYFWSGRERGLTLYGSTTKEFLDYEAGIYDGSPINQPRSTPRNFVVEGRVTVNPFGPVNANEFPFTPEGEPLPMRFSFVLQGYYGRMQTTIQSYNPDNSELTPVQTMQTEKNGTIGVDAWFQKGPAIVFGEYYWRRLNPLDSAGGEFNSTGAWGQILMNIYKSYLGLGVRFNWIDPNQNLNSDQVWEIEGQVAWFIHPTDLVLKVRYAWLKQNSPAAETLGNFILPYIVGTTNVVTLQLALSF